MITKSNFDFDKSYNKLTVIEREGITLVQGTFIKTDGRESNLCIRVHKYVEYSCSSEGVIEYKNLSDSEFEDVIHKSKLSILRHINQLYNGDVND